VRVRLLLSALLAAAIFVFLLWRVDVAAVWAEIQAMTWLELLSIAAVAVWNFATYWALWVAVTPGLTWPQAMVVAQSGTAVTNTVPGGSGIGVGLTYAMLNSWGFSRGRGTLAVLITGMANDLIKLCLPVLALALLALQGDASGSRVVVGVVAIGLLAAAVTLLVLILRSERVARRAGELAGRAASPFRRLLRRPPAQGWEQATVKFRSRAGELLRRRWPAIVAAALVSHLSLYLVLLVALRHVGVPDQAVGWAEVLFVFASTRLLTAVRFTPGGAGVVEALLIGGLVAAGGQQHEVAAAVLVFRGLTWLLPVPIGGLTYLAWRRQQARRRASATDAAPVADA
jgi:putative heme transporter